MAGDAATDKIAGIGTAAVREATGRGWAGWLEALDAAGAEEIPHPEIARLLREEHGLSGWWSQMVTVGYEQARGLREPHETTRGYQVSVSRTIGVPLDRLYAAWDDEEERRGWLGPTALTVRSASPGKSLRFTWGEDGTSVDVRFYEKGPEKSRVVVDHDRLPDGDVVERRRAFWKERLDGLKARLTS